MAATYHQHRVQVVSPNGELHFDRIVNDNLDGHVAQARQVAWAEDRIVIEGRRRLNDYVGSPQWSEWEQV